MKCRFCNEPLKFEFIDLNNTPASNSYIKKENMDHVEEYFPLKVYVCHECKLVQLAEYKKHNEIFNEEYSYFSSFSTSWLEHSKNYVEMISNRISLGKSSKVLEIASNDGYLLQYFQEKNIPCLGIEPTKSTAKVAKEKGIETIQEFFGYKLAKKLGTFDLVLGNNVLAHVPDINDFVKGLKNVLKENGTITMEFPHLLNLLQYNQFDTIYHEHFSYLSLYTVKQIFENHGLKIYDVEQLSTHGGSLRIYATHKENENVSDTLSVETILNKEKAFGLLGMEVYKNFSKHVNNIKYDLLEFLIKIKRDEQKVIGYGAAAKGNTLLNYCGVKKDLIPYVVDKSPHKQGKYLPSSHIKIVDESIIKELKPEYILILPWNLKDEIIEQLAYVKEWNCKFITAIPNLEIF